jgi:Predicted membrane protein (DUF2127)
MRAGDPPRTRLVLRVIAVERSLRGLLLLAAGTYLLFHLSTDFGHLAERVIRSIDIDPRQRFFHRIVTRLHRLHARAPDRRSRRARLRRARAGRGFRALARSALGRVPDRDRHFAADPLRALRACDPPSFWKAGGIVVNVVIVLYLVVVLRRRLAAGTR